MSEHGSLSKLSEKCNKCNKKDACDNKRMEMCAYIIPSTISNATPSVKPEINTCIGNEYVNTKDIEKSISEQIYKKLAICDRH